MKLFKCLLVFIFLASCATSPSSNRRASRGGESRSTGQPQAKQEQQREKSFYISKETTDIVYSPGTSRYDLEQVDRKKIQDILKKFKPDQEKQQDLFTQMTLLRLGQASLDQVLNVSENLMKLEIKRDRNADVPYSVKLELALAAAGKNNFMMADFYTRDLLKSKNKKVLSRAYMIQGWVAFQEGLVPEAVDLWKKSLQNDSRNVASRLNLGMLAAQYGDFETAIKMLGQLLEYPAAKVALLTVNRFTGRINQADSLCKELSNNKQAEAAQGAIFFNCALFYYQNQSQHQQAIQYIDQVFKVAKSQKWEFAADRLKTEILVDLEKAKMKK